MRRLYPFPVSHPYDEYAMVDLEHPELQAFPKLGALRGAVATVRENEAIFIPTRLGVENASSRALRHWWHHVQGLAGEGGA